MHDRALARPGSRAALLLIVAKTVLAASALVLLVSVALSGPEPSSPEADERIQLRTTALQQAMTRHDCSRTGFGRGVQPRAALIRVDGELRHVPFQRGWAVFTGRRPGTFLAVCRG